MMKRRVRPVVPMTQVTTLTSLYRGGNAAPFPAGHTLNIPTDHVAALVAGGHVSVVGAATAAAAASVASVASAAIVASVHAAPAEINVAGASTITAAAPATVMGAHP